MAAGPVYNPPVPYLGPIPGGVAPGKMIRVHGDVPYHSQRFAVNLQCGPGVNPRDDMGLHLNFRFPEQCIVRNHLAGGVWGSEEIHGGMPLSPGQSFQLLILSEPTMFKIALNGGHFCEFPHRLAYQRLDHITIDGDVTVSMIAFEGGDPVYQAPPTYSAATQPGFNMAPPGYGSPQQPYPPNAGYVPPNASLSYAGMPPSGFGQPGISPPIKLVSQAPPYGAPPMYSPGMAPPQVQTESTGSKMLRYGLPIAGGAAAGVGAYYLTEALTNKDSDEEQPEPDADDWLGDD